MWMRRLWISLTTLAFAAPTLAESDWMLPQVDYTADTYMQGDVGVLRGRMWASGDKERREVVVQGRTHVVILRKDRELAVLELAKGLAAHYDLEPALAVDVFRWMIELTKDVEVLYVRRRLGLE